MIEFLLVAAVTVTPTKPIFGHDHGGWETACVRATKYRLTPQNVRRVGFDIKFGALDARAFNWLASNGIKVVFVGGESGQELLTEIPGVTDTDADAHKVADAFLIEFLPKFDDWIRQTLGECKSR